MHVDLHQHSGHVCENIALVFISPLTSDFGCSLADEMKMSSASAHLASVVTLLVSLLIVKTLT